MMIQPTKKLRLGELQVNSFVTTPINNTDTIKAGGGFTQVKDECTDQPKTQPACLPEGTWGCSLNLCTNSPIICTNMSVCGCLGATSPVECGGSQFCEC